MFKKNSWIVALFAALTLTAFFTGCIDVYVAPEEEYEEIELGEFNVWGGQTYQRGWADKGMKFLGAGDKPEVTKDKGYDSENFMKATKLKIEMEDSGHPYGNLDLVWGAADDNGDSVGYDWKQTGGVKFVKEGNVITIDLTVMVEYAKYKDPVIGAKRKLILQLGGESAGLPFVKKAWLLIPTKEEPFVSLTGLTLKSVNGVAGKAFELEPVFTPANASVQNISWAIYQNSEAFETDPNTAQAEFADVDTSVITPGRPQSKTKLMAFAEGSVLIKATLSSAVLSGGKYVSFTKDFKISFINPAPLSYTVIGKAVQGYTKEYEGIEKAKLSVDPNAETNTPSAWIELTGVDDYGAPAYYIGANLGIGQVIGNFNSFDFKYTGTLGNGSNDTGGRNFRIMADKSPMRTNMYSGTAKYIGANSSYDISSGANPASIGIGTLGSIPNNDTNQLGGISNSGSNDTANKELQINIGSLNTQFIYYKLIPWNNAATTRYRFENITFKKVALKYKVNTTDKTTTDTRSFTNNEGVSTIQTLADSSGFKATHFNTLDGKVKDKDESGYGQNQNFFKIDLGADKLKDYVNSADYTQTGSVSFKIKLDKALTTGAGGIRVKFDKDPTAPTNGGSLWGGLTNYRVSGTVTEIPADTEVTVTIPLGYDTRNTTAPTGPFAGIVGNDEIMELSQMWVWIYPQANNVTFTVTDIEFIKALTPTPPPALPAGELFNLNTWLTTNTAIGDPFAQSGSPTYTITASGADKGIKLTDIVNDYDALDIKLAKVNSLIDIATYKIKVTVTGKVLELHSTVGTSSPVTVTEARMILQGKDGSNGYDEDAKQTGLHANDDFSISYEIPAGKTFDGIRILSSAEGWASGADTNNKAHIKSFIITGIVVSNEGAR